MINKNMKILCFSIIFTVTINLVQFHLGYILNDGSIGVCFNDSTKIFTKKEFK